jgi:hypothetical protein
MMMAVLRSSMNPRLILLVSSVGRIEVTAWASLVGIVRPSSNLVSASAGGSCRGSSIEGCLDGSPKALRGALDLIAHSDDSLRSRHLQYHV